MMPNDRFDRRLPAILDEISQPRTPDYFDDLIGLTARTRQRPAWTLLERWLPMVDIARQPAFARQVPWRPIAVLTLILLLVAASLALVIGSQHPLPTPFGLARNGLVAYAKDGDIYTADPITGGAKAVVIGPETDLRPIFSLDGSRFAFERKAHGSSGPGSLYVANADGTGLLRVTPNPLDVIDTYAFSPDGRDILISTGAEGAGSLFIAKSNGSGIRWLATGGLAGSQPDYRPPLGDEIVFVGRTSGPGASGLYAIGADGTGLRTLVQSSTFVIDNPKWAPDGTRIAYSTWAADLSTQARVHIISADGSGDHLLRQIAADALEGWPNAWSNDGSRLLVNGCRPDPADPTKCVGYLSVVPADGGGTDVKLPDPVGPVGTDATAYLWAPDDGSILATPVDAQDQPLAGASVIDMTTGQSRPVPWAGTVNPSWQRLAP
jgi:dipeptidyl aminopeptidase/acylaminoacyl peptidase